MFGSLEAEKRNDTGPRMKKRDARSRSWWDGGVVDVYKLRYEDGRLLSRAVEIYLHPVY
jgi:hypothetical protein